MDFLLFSTWACLSTCLSFSTLADDCNFKVSMELKKTGFHRELETIVLFKNKHFDKMLLVYSWPKDIYVDPFQLSSLRNQINWEMLLGTTMDLELPAHKSSGFRTYLFLKMEEITAGHMKLTIPIHGRYQKPSFNGNAFNSIDIYPPNLLLRPVETCTQVNNFGSVTTTVVDAPCTAKNSSICQWANVHFHQPDPVILQLPVGDASLVIHVCGGTLLFTIICTVALSKSALTRT
ncbi:unnamed protein product [Knipowitschia caucasica]